MNEAPSNETLDPVFDETLEPAFTVAMEGASFINSYNRGTAHKIAIKIQPGATRLNEQLARLRCYSRRHQHRDFRSDQARGGPLPDFDPSPRGSHGQGGHHKI